MSTRKPDLVESVGATLARLARTSLSRSAFAHHASAADTELSQSAYTLLRILIDDGALPIGRLAKIADMDVGMATRRVQALVESGLAVRVADTTDGRLSVIRATVNGARAAASLHEVRRDYLGRALSGWSVADLEQFERLLMKFLDDAVATPLAPT